MNNIYLVSISISIAYFLVKYVEIKYKNNSKDNSWFKPLFKDTLIVSIVSICCQMLMEQFLKISNYKSSPDVFVGEPDF